jgi:hypothetical protein
MYEKNRKNKPNRKGKRVEQGCISKMQGQAQTQTCKNISLTKKQMEVRIAPGGAGSNSQGLSPRPNPAKNSFNKKREGGCAE